MSLKKCKSTLANNPFRWDEESSLTLGQPTTPPSSPILLPSKRFIALSDKAELAGALIDMQMASIHTSRCTCSHTPPEEPSETASTDFCSPSTPCHTFPANQPSPQIVTTEHVQQFFDILMSVSAKQGSPPSPAAADKVESEELKARASTLEFKKVNEVYVYAGLQSNFAGANTIQLGQKGIQV
jgi:hypothetical protein